MNTCGRCIHKPFCQSPGPVCSSFKDRDRFADRDEVVREVAERLKKKSYIPKPYGMTGVVDVYEIDTLVKEMTDKHDR